MPPAVDLCTEVGHAPKVPPSPWAYLAEVRNVLFLNNIMLFNYCAEVTIALPDGNLGNFPAAYSQSYPQNLWVSHFVFCSNGLRAYAKTFSSIGRQAYELT
jgi:hypothetical protein